MDQDYRAKCDKKTQFHSKKHAKQTIQKVRRAATHEPKAGRLVAYLCPYCGFYHIGHKRRRREA